MSEADTPGPQGKSGQAAADRHEIFEQIALERLRSGADTGKPVGFLPLPVRLTAVSAVSITGLGLLWACLAQVPVQVNGVATVIPQVEVSSVIARVDGILAYQVSGVGPDRLSTAERVGDQALSQFWQETVNNNAATLPFERLNQLALAALAPVQGQPFISPDSLDSEKTIDNLTLSEKEYSLLRYASGTIIARILSNVAMEELNVALRGVSPKLELDQAIGSDRRKRSVEFSRIDTLLHRQYKNTQAELKGREELFNRLQALWNKGFVSTSQLLSEQSQINALRNQLLQLNREQLNTEFSGADQREQANQSSLSIAQTTNQLQEALVSYMTKTFIITPPSGAYSISSVIRNGMQIRAGDEIGTYSVEKPTLPELIPVFVDAATSQQLGEGMQVLVTPRGISRAQYGGIPGVVVAVGKLPLPAEGLAAFAGGRTLAASIQQGVGTAYLVRVKLEQQEVAYCQQMLSRRCYRWSTNRRPPSPVRLGTLADVQINVEYRRPIEFVMPALRQAFGLVVENR